MATVTETKRAGAEAKAPRSQADARRLAMQLKPRRKTPAEALPSALHLAVSAAASFAAVAAVFIAVTETQKQPIKRLVQNGCTLAAVTIALIAMPQLGNSVGRGVQRIVGVMIGGWLFCGLFMAYQAWWYLALLLGAFTFAVVASSHLIVGQQYMSPPMVVAAFVVCVGFDSPQAAVDATVVKTCGIAAGIILYTFFSSILFPRTATQQVIDTLGVTMYELRDLADVILRGRKAGAAGPTGVAAGRASGQDNGGDAAVSAGDVIPPPGRSQAGSGTRGIASASALVATIPHHFREIQGLLPSTRKEKFVARLPGAGFMCYVPAPVRSQNTTLRTDVLAVLHVSYMVHRALWLMMTPGEEDGTSTGSIVDALLPKALEAQACPLVNEMGNEAVAALQEFADALPHGGAPRAIVVSGGHVQRYNLLCRELYRLSLQLHEQPAAALGPRARWQRAITAITEINAARRGGPGAISRLVGGMLQRGDVESTRWCATLLLLQQLGEGLARLQDSMGTLLPTLPGAKHAAAAVTPMQPAGADRV